jgi:hypothetical protein
LDNIGAFRRYNNKIFFIIICIIIVASLYDSLLIKLYRFIYGQVFSGSDIEESTTRNTITFTMLVAVYGIGQYLVLRYLNYKTREINVIERLQVSIIQKLVLLIQYAIAALLVLIIFQMVTTVSYSVVVLFLIVALSYTLAVAMLGLLAQRFFSWFKSNRNKVVLSYGLASVALSVNAAFTMAYVGDLFTNQPGYVSPHILHISMAPSTNSVLNLGYVISSIISFMLTWIATVLLLRHHSKKLGKAVYWITVTIPLVYFLGQFQPLLLNAFEPYRMADPVLFGIIYTLVFYLSKPVGGIMFGIAFWNVAKNLGQTTVREYMIISAFGFVLLFMSNQAIVLVNFDYPPFGLSTISYFGVSCYLLFVGIYSAAISISQDVRLRQLVRKFALQESKLLDSIGSAQVEREIFDKVLLLTKKTKDSMTSETGLDTSLEENDMKDYLGDVLAEIKRQKDKQ